MTRQRCEFSLVRYVPDPVKNEFVNIGVLLKGEDARAAVRFTRDWSRVRCLDPDADTAMLEALEGEMGRRLAEDGVASLEDALSNAVQLSESKACLAESFAAEMDSLMALYVQTVKRKRETRQTGRTALVARMRAEFERAGVWELMQKRIGAARYTRPGDPLRIDCGYSVFTNTLSGQQTRGAAFLNGKAASKLDSVDASFVKTERPNGIVRMFQAVSLGGDLESAKVLAFSAGDLRDGVLRVEQAGLELTAIVEPLKDIAEEDAYRFGVETMEREQIRVLTAADLGRVAETVRRELRV